MKQLKILASLLVLGIVFNFVNLQNSFACEEDDDCTAIRTAYATAITASVFNIAATGLNIGYAVGPNPMKTGGKFLAGSSIAVGAATAIVAFSGLASQGSITGVHEAQVIGVGLTGVSALGTGIWSLVADKKQRNKIGTISPLFDKNNQITAGAMLTRSF